MSPQAREILDAATALPEEDREAIVELLTLTLTNQLDAEGDLAWQEELARRIREVEEGKAELIPWEEVRDRVLKRPRVTP